MQLRHHALRQFPHFAGALDGCLGEKAFRLGAIESRVHALDVVERLRNPQPARQHGDIGDKTDIPHELIAFFPGIAPQYLQLSLIRGEPEDGVQRRVRAGAFGTDESDNAALFDAQVDTVQRDSRSEGLAEAACFYACHSVSVPPSWCRASAGRSLRHPAVLRPGGPAAEWSPESGAIRLEETSGVRPAEADCARRH